MCILKVLKLSFSFIALVVLLQSIPHAHAIPTRIEAYRNDKLKTIVYKDSEDANVFWYIPPVKLLEKDGNVVFYKRVKTGEVLYTFYLVPYMNDELIEMLTGEINGFTNRSQLRPLPVQKFGVKLDSFNASSLLEVNANYQYLNMPQLVKVNLKDSDVEDFDFFLSNLPGVPVQVLFTYESEKLSKFLSIELSYKEVYDALNVGAKGKYSFTKAEIALGIENYISNKYLTIKSKGELPIPEIVNKVIEECFTPMAAKKTKPLEEIIQEFKNNSSPGKSSLTDELSFEKMVRANLEETNRLAVGFPPQKIPEAGGKKPEKDDDDDDDDIPSGKRKKPDSSGEGPELQFTFKKELSKNDKKFYFRQEQFEDATETVSVPSYLSTVAGSSSSMSKTVQPLGKWNFLVAAQNDSTHILSTNIQVGQGEQYILSSVFAYKAENAYSDGMQWYRWESTWPNPDEELYYRVGAGPWTRLNARSVIHSDGIYKGTLEFYIDRRTWFEKIPEKYRKGKLGGIIAPVFTYAKTYPQFSVTVSGRKILYTKPVKFEF